MIAFRPKAGMVLMCNFTGYQSPEIVKTRPVVVISPNHMLRPQLVTVVPLSSTAPAPIEPYHYELINNPLPGKQRSAIWAKCDLVATVRFDRLDRIKINRGTYEVGHVSMDQVRDIRRCVAIGIGIDLSSIGG